jgi:Domain of unknown function (DUF4878)
MLMDSSPHKRLARIFIACLTALSLAAFAGCGPFGGNSPEDAIKDFSEAVADGDGEKACDLVTDDYKEEEFGGDECEEQVEAFGDEASDEDKDKLRDVEVSDVEEDGDKATAKVKTEGEDEDEVELEKVDGDWKLSGEGGDN